MDGQMCDVCPAHAQARVTFRRTGQRLYFCLHHVHEYFPETGVYPGIDFSYSKTLVNS